MLRKFRNSWNIKIAPHKHKSIVKFVLAGRCPPPLANGTLCLSTPKHNGKSGIEWTWYTMSSLDVHLLLMTFRLIGPNFSHRLFFSVFVNSLLSNCILTLNNENSPTIITGNENSPTIITGNEHTKHERFEDNKGENQSLRKTDSCQDNNQKKKDKRTKR